MTEDIELYTKLSEKLYSDIDENKCFPKRSPLVAHYTSITTLECILRTNEIWFSNPLFMNDFEELRFGMNEGKKEFLLSEVLKKAAGTPERFQALSYSFNYYYGLFEDEHALDVYVFCLSEHDDTELDGKLSMWRGYGDSGNGVAIVFDLKKLEEAQDSPLIIAPVEYLTREKRIDWFKAKLVEVADFLNSNNIEDKDLWRVAYAVFERFKMFAVFTKHSGFKEEEEWRVAFFKDRDQKEEFKSMFSYAIGRRGVEPKLKFKLEPILDATAEDLSFKNIVHQIILGPTIANQLVKGSVERMLEKLELPELKDRVIVSGIPFRNT